MPLTNTEKGVAIAIGVAAVVLFLMLLFSRTTRGPILIGVLGISMMAIVGLIVFTMMYKPPTTAGRPTGSTLAPLNFHNLDPGLDVVHITMPWGEAISLNSGSSLYGQEIYATEQILATGFRGTTEYNENYTNNTVTNLDIYYSTGGPKSAGQYITNMVLDNSAKSSQTTIWATDGTGVWYPYATLPGSTRGASTAWVGQAFATNATGSGAVTTSSTKDNTLVIQSDGTIKPFSS